MSQEWECLVSKKIGDDVSGDFASNAGMTRFNGIADFADDMSFYAGDQTKFDANWLPQNSGVTRGNPSTQVIDWQQDQGNFRDDSIAFDLWSQGIFPSDISWTLRCKWTVTTQNLAGANNEAFCICLKSTALGQGSAPAPATNGDWIGFSFFSNVLGVMRLQAADQAGFFPLQSFTDFTTSMTSFTPPYTFYVEIKRTSATSCECTLYNDAAYTSVFEKVKATVPANVTALRYLLFSNEIVTPSTGVHATGTFDEVEFFNGTEGPAEQIVLHGDELGDVSIFNPGTATKIITGADDGNWVVGGGPSVSGGVVTGWGADAVWRRAIYDLQGNDGLTLDDFNWTIDFDFTRTDNDNNPGHNPFGVIKAPFNSDPTNASGNQPAIGMGYGAHLGNGHKVFLKVSNGGDLAGITPIISSLPDIQPINQNQTYYMRMMRINGTRAVLEVYTNPQRTALLGFKVIDGVPPATTGLNWINSSTSTNGGSGRILNGTVANITIYDGVSQQFAGGSVLFDDFSTYGSPVPATVSDDFSTNNYLEQDTTRIRVETDRELLKGLFLRTGITSGASRPLTIDDSNWIVQFGLSLTDFIDDPFVNTVAVYGMFDHDSSTSYNAAGTEGIYMDIQVGISGDQFRLQQTTNGLNAGVTSISLARTLTEERVYVQLKREGSLATLSLYRDKNYSELLESKSLAVTVTGLTHFVVTNNDAPTVTQPPQIDACIFDWNFWNLRSTTCDPVAPTATFLEDFSSYVDQTAADAAWVPQITFPSTGFVQVDVAADNLRWQMIRNGSDNRNTFDLGAIVDPINNVISDTHWTCRFKYTLNAGNILTSTNSANFQLLIQDTDVGQSSINDSISYGEIQSPLPDGREMRLIVFNNNSIVGFASEPNNAVAYSGSQVDYYMEMTRLTPLLVRGRRFSDANYTVLIEELLEPYTGAPTNLRYLIASSGDDVLAWNGTELGTIDDIEFYNGLVTGKVGSALTPWSGNSPTGIFVDDCQENIQWNINGDTNDILFFDLGAPLSDDKWVMRFVQTIQNQDNADANGVVLYLGLGDNAEIASTAQDFLGFIMTIDATALQQYWRTLRADNQPLTSGTQGTSFALLPAADQKIYWEMIREDTTTFRLTMFADANYTFPIETQTTSPLASVDNLRYVKLMQLIVPSTNFADGQIDDIKIWDGVDVADSIDARRYLQLVAHSEPGLPNLDVATVRFNLDRSSNYGYKQNFNGGADSTTDPTNEIRIQGGKLVAAAMEYEVLMYNPVDLDKWLQSNAADTNGVGATVPNRSENVGTWRQPSKLISRIGFRDNPNFSGIWGTDTEAVVFGSD